MKMDVVLSLPGKFSDDEAAPFKSEEIREWSRVDRLTGMLERARIETGRWQASSNASRHSYGKVSDQRERNSVDGSVMQKAKRQVEIFQSHEPGRSVQVFRASQWSSSRITENIPEINATNEAVSGLNDVDSALLTDSWKLPLLCESPSSDLGVSPVEESFLPQKDSVKSCSSFGKYLLPKRSNSDEDFSSLLGNGGSPPASFSRDCKSRRSLQIPSTPPTASNDSANREIYSSMASATSGPRAASVRIENPQKSPEYGSLRCGASANRPSAVTVVNLMSGEDDSKTKTSIVTLRGSPVTTKEPNLTLGKTNSSGDEGSLSLPGRAVKKVGFCKTEVHFAADSGKVNIVETDGKPPPTNKFRRRRRTQNPSAGYSVKPLESSSPLGNGRVLSQRTVSKPDSPGPYCIADLEGKKFWEEPVDNARLHMTTVNVGKANGRHREFDELKKSEELTSPKAVSDVISRRIRDKNNSNIVVTKDAENNRVLSTIVKTHESTIARVEDNIPKIKKSTGDIESSTKIPSFLQKKRDTKSNKTTNKLSSSLSSPSSAKENHVYVNVFKTSNDKFPIYENYRAENSKNKSSPEVKESRELSSLVSDVTKSLKSTLERKRNKAKSPSSNKPQSKALSGSLPRSTITNDSTEKKTNTSDSSLKRLDIKTGSASGNKPKRQPMEVVYETAVYNMKNEKLCKANKSKAKRKLH